MIEREKRDRLSEAQNHRCCYCGERFADGSKAATLEHVRARANGGSNAYANLVVACLRCNGLRGSMNAYQFAERRLWERETLAEAGKLPAEWRPKALERATLAAVWPKLEIAA